MLTDITAATSAAALVAILVAIGVLLARASRWPDFTEPPKHAPHPDAYRPRPYDQVILSEAYISIPLPKVGDDGELVEDMAPISAPPVIEEEPIDELDPRWDWQAYADAQERELVAA